jgi:hypothetical protein
MGDGLTEFFGGGEKLRSHAEHAETEYYCFIASSTRISPSGHSATTTRRPSSAMTAWTWTTRFGCIYSSFHFENAPHSRADNSRFSFGIGAGQRIRGDVDTLASDIQTDADAG